MYLKAFGFIFILLFTLFSVGFSELLPSQQPLQSAHIIVKAADIELAEMGKNGHIYHHHHKHFNTEAKMILKNTGDYPVKLVAANTPLAKRVQIHQWVDIAQGRKMQRIDSLLIPPHGEDDLSYSGIHIMLMGLHAKLFEAEKIPLTLIFADGSYVIAHTTVKKLGQKD